MSAIGETLAREGYLVFRRAVPDELLAPALRRLNLEILRCGLSARQIEEWKYATFWPTLRSEPEIVALREPVAQLLGPEPAETWGDAQLLLRFPDEAEEWPLAPHTDELPEWAGSRRYEAIAGVALTRSRERDGCLAVWSGSHRGEEGPVELIELDEGDVVVLHPELQHSSTLNRGGAVRYAVYLRLLSAP